MTEHLPYEAQEDAYREEAYERYGRVEDDIDDAFGEEDSGSITTSAFAVTVGAYVATSTRDHGLVPSSTLPVSAQEYEWFDRHAIESYQQGQRFASVALNERGYDVPGTPGIDQSHRHRHAIKELHERQRRYWNSLATDLETDVKGALREAIDEGATAQQARAVATDRVDKLAFDRARKIAHTEPAWGFNRALLEEYADAGAEGVEVSMQWETMGDGRVCSACQSRSGHYELDAARTMMEENDFPEHSECRCLLLPA